MEKQTLFLSGSGGFIGKNLQSYLQDGFHLLTPRSAELDLRNAYTTREFFQKHPIDVIIHCGSVGGARGVADAATTINDNLVMVENILASKSPQARLITFGSGAMYGKSRNLHKVREEEIGSFIPEDLYGQAKMLLAQRYAHHEDVLFLNIFGCYGYGELPSRFPTYALTQNLKKEPIIINQNVVFDYLFVEDMQKIVSYFVTHKPTRNIINITPTDSVSLLQLSELTNELGTFKSEIIIKNSVLNNEYTGNNTCLKEEFPNVSFTSYYEGMKKLRAYLQAHASW